ncbi:MAG: Crp/Fnr family transcriptional regulator [Pseudorhodoplanes sp.]|nr:Crp/Fnr family transcriptional regulator [Pseudorhodoplanes sp.]
MSKQSEFAVLLKMNALFAGLGDEALNNIANLCSRRQIDGNEVLFQKGDKGDALYGIRRGQIRIETGTAGGGRLTLNIMGPGDVFGEIALLDGQARTADATATEKSELYVLRRDDFLAYLQREPSVSLRLIELLCQRIRWTSERMEEASLLPLNVRLARRLVSLAADFGSEVHISQEQLGQYVGAARESVNRQLQEWRKQGILELGRSRIDILKLDKLTAESKKN